jgi:hypothetical protein
MSEEALDGHQSKNKLMLHDYEVEYIVRDVSKEDAQALLNEFPQTWYVIDKYYEPSKRRLEFTLMLDDVSPVEISDHYDYMEQNHPECRRRFEQLHDFRSSFDDEENDLYNQNAVDLNIYNDRTLP